MSVDGEFRQIHEPGNLFCRLSFLDEIGNLDFFLRKMQKLQG